MNENANPQVLDPLMRLPAVMAATGLSRSTVYQMVKDQKMPSPVRLGERAVAWRQSEIARFLGSRVQAR